MPYLIYPIQYNTLAWNRSELVMTRQHMRQCDRACDTVTEGDMTYVLWFHIFFLIWVDFLRTGIMPVSCHLKKTCLDRCGQIWFARPLFSTVLWKSWLVNYTSSASTPHQFTTMHCNASKFAKMHWIVSHKQFSAF